MIFEIIVVLWLSMNSVIAAKDTVQSSNENGFLSVELLSKYDQKEEIKSGKSHDYPAINMRIRLMV